MMPAVVKHQSVPGKSTADLCRLAAVAMLCAIRKDPTEKAALTDGLSSLLQSPCVLSDIPTCDPEPVPDPV